MVGFRILVGECPPGKDCPKVARSENGRIAVVGEWVTDPAALRTLGVGPGEAAVEISEAMYVEAAELLAAEHAGKA